MINKQRDIDKIYLYPKIFMKKNISYWLIKKIVGLKCFNGPEAFIKYSNDMQDVYKNIDEC